MKVLKIFKSPIRALLLSFIIWLIIFIIPTHEYTIQVNNKGILILLSYITSFIFGSVFVEILYRRKNGKIIEVYNEQEKLYNPIWIKTLLVLGSLGIVLKYYDLIINKKYFMYGGAADFKSNYVGGDFGLINIISGVLFPLILVTFIAYFDQQRAFNKKQRLWNIINFVFLLGYSVLIGARTQMTLMLLALLFVIAIKNKKILYKIKFKRFRGIKIFLVLFIVGFVFFLYSVNVLSDRLEYQNKGTDLALQYLEDAHHVKVSDKVWENVYLGNVSGDILYTCISLRHYFIHGIYQFQVLVDTYPLDNIAFGQWQFNPIFKALSLIGVPYKSVQDISMNIRDYGVYTSFFGDVYIDFGLYGFIYMIALGGITQIIYRKIFKSVQAKIMYTLNFSIIVHMFFINMIAYGMGLYYILSFILGLYIIPILLKGGIQCEEK